MDSERPPADFPTRLNVSDITLCTAGARVPVHLAGLLIYSTWSTRMPYSFSVVQISKRNMRAKQHPTKMLPRR